MTSDQQRRLAAVQAGQTQLANISKDKELIAEATRLGLYMRIDRQTVWGNPFVLGQHGNRDEVISSYRNYIRNRPELLARAEELRGKLLGCWCYPQPCHGGVLCEEMGLRERQQATLFD